MRSSAFVASILKTQREKGSIKYEPPRRNFITSPP
jgi:hypothetical protein